MATYSTKHTAHGLQRMAAAEASGVKINLPIVVVGDGGGNPIDPAGMETQTQLVREVFRTAPNRIYQSADDSQVFIIEVVIPATKGGFTVREIGAIDDQGALFVIANTPEAYKPVGDGSEGSFGDIVIRFKFKATNASIVTLQIDPHVAVATQSWITNTITIGYVLPGGTTGQIATKRSNADGDIVWTDPTVANVVVSTVEETQVLAATQVDVTLNVCTTLGLAVYIAGNRLTPDDWTKNPDDAAKLTLKKSYPAGSVADFVQNEPAAFIPTPLVASKNLGDVPDVDAARSNLGVDSKANTDTHAPPGMVAYFLGSTAPAGWLKANGAAVSRQAYSNLFARIGTTFGQGNGFTTYNLPDLRGEFLRAWDDARGVDAGRDVGSWQKGTLVGGYDDDAQNNNVSYGANRGTADYGSDAVQLSNYPGASLYYLNPSPPLAVSPVSNASGMFSVARPRNVALLACIKY
ncbi:phage tail protein [Burkholderia plantarii]|uniref:phage tail-collar fiber domain-containing protein n=1 Tax=Burkholderia plantarii TaxID=41899 RepID=UPI00272A26E9|nr:phage tail protein [Burkholderia plantarii]WLE59282.1 phage tail protein [Burkholderia plantarii]